MQPYGDNFIPVIPCEEIIHTAAHPHCRDNTCPCHANQAHLSGLLPNAEMARIVQKHLQQVESVAIMTIPTKSRIIAPQPMAIGNGSIIVNSEDFINGYQAGHLACILDCRAAAAGRYSLTNENVTEILMEKLEDVNLPQQYSIGYCVGWSATLATKGNAAQPQPQESADEEVA